MAVYVEKINRAAIDFSYHLIVFNHSKGFSSWALIFDCAFQFNILFSNQFLSSLIEPTIAWVKHPREMGKAEKLSLLHLPIRKVDRKEPRWSARLSDELMRMPSDSTLERVLHWRWMRPLRLTERRARTMKNGKRSAPNDRTRSKNQYACTNDNHEFLWTEDCARFENYRSSFILFLRRQWHTSQTNLTSRFLSEIVSR